MADQRNKHELVVEVIYATPESQKLRQVVINRGADIEACIVASGILNEHPDWDLNALKVGIFSQVKSLNHPVRHGDRIEIYRELIADPKAVRRRKAEAAKAAKK